MQQEQPALDSPSDAEPNNRYRLRIAVIGNSNSVMREAYVRVLEAIPNAVVANKSIGTSP